MDSGALSGIFNALSGLGFSMTENQTLAATQALEDAMKKAAGGLGSLGYQTATGMAGGDADLSPLVAQSIDDQLAEGTTFKDSDFVIYEKMPRDKAIQTLHEIRIRKTYGNRHQASRAAEGEAGINGFETYASDSVKIKWWAERGELTYQAANLPSAGVLVSGSMLAEKTANRMMSLRRNLEIDSIWGDSSIDDLSIDGLIPQIEAKTDRVEDLEGAELTFDRIERRLGEDSNVDVGARPTHLFVTPGVWHDLSRQAQDGKDRWDATSNSMGKAGPNFSYGASGLQVFSQHTNRSIEIVKAPFLDIERTYGTPFKTGTIPVEAYDPKTGKAPTALISISQQPNHLVHASSKFKAGDAGTYKYWILALNEFGQSAAIATDAVTVAAGERVEILLNVPGIVPRYYYLFRTSKDGVDSTARYIKTVKYNTSGAGAKVQLLDANEQRRNASRALLVNFADNSEIAFYRLLPLARIPLAMVELKVPFTIFMSGACKVKVPEKQFVWKGVGVSNPT